MIKLRLLNPKITTEIKESRKLQKVLSDVLKEIENNIQMLNRIESINFLELLKEALSYKINEIENLIWRSNELVKRINIGESYSELRDIHGELNEIQKSLFEILPSPLELQEFCTDYRDRISKKVISMVIRELIGQNIYLPEESFAYIAVGSDGRKEQTLITDQDNLIVYEASKSRYKDFFYQKFSELLVERMNYCGFKKCTGNIMPSNPQWRGTMDEWIHRVEKLCSFTSDDFKKNLVNLIVLTDLRFIYGDEELAQQFINKVLNMLYNNHIVLSEIAKSAASLNLAKGFIRGFRVEKKGDFKGFINIKLNAWAPLILVIRAFAIKNKVFATSTLERIKELVKKGAFGSKDGALYEKVYYTMTKFKIMCQVYYLNGIYKDANYLNPNDLTDNEKNELIDALTVVDKLQKLLINSMGLRI